MFFFVLFFVFFVFVFSFFFFVFVFVFVVFFFLGKYSARAGQQVTQAVHQHLLTNASTVQGRQSVAELNNTTKKQKEDKNKKTKNKTKTKKKKQNLKKKRGGEKL